jgi:hypothetical protein
MAEGADKARQEFLSLPQSTHFDHFRRNHIFDRAYRIFFRISLLPYLGLFAMIRLCR